LEHHTGAFIIGPHSLRQTNHSKSAHSSFHHYISFQL
jgi:hypothetical protein